MLWVIKIQQILNLNNKKGNKKAIPNSLCFINVPRSLVACFEKNLRLIFTKGRKQIFCKKYLFDKVKKFTSEHLFYIASGRPESFAAARRRSCRYVAPLIWWKLDIHQIQAKKIKSSSIGKSEMKIRLCFLNEWNQGLKDSCLISDNMERLPQRQVSLNKFIRLAGDLLMPSLYAPYVQLLVNLCGHPEAALHCFNLLKLNGGLAGKSL